MDRLLLTVFLYSRTFLVISACPSRPKACSTNCKDKEECRITETYTSEKTGSDTSTPPDINCNAKTNEGGFFVFEVSKSLNNRARFLSRYFSLKNCTDITFSFNSTPSFAPALKKAGWELKDSPVWKGWPQCAQLNNTCENYIDDFSSIDYQLSCKNPCSKPINEERKKVFIVNFKAFLNISNFGIALPAANPTTNTVTSSKRRTATNKAHSRTSATSTRETVATPYLSPATQVETNTTTTLETSTSTDYTDEIEPVTSNPKKSETSKTSTSVTAKQYHTNTTEARKPNKTAAFITETPPDTTSAGFETSTKTSKKEANTGINDTTVPESTTSGTTIKNETSAHTDKELLESTTTTPNTKTPTQTLPDTQVTVTTKSTTAKPQEKQNNDSINHLWWIIPVAVIVVVLLVAGAIIGFVCWKKRKNIASDVTQRSASVESANPSTAEQNQEPTDRQPSHKREPTEIVNREEAAEVASPAVSHQRKEVDKSVEADGGEQDHSMQTSEGLLDKILREMREKEKLEKYIEAFLIPAISITKGG